MPPVVDHSPFPPSFDGNPWSYGFALTSLTLICALALAMLLGFLFEARARRAAWSVSAVKGQGPLPLASPVMIHRLIISGFLVTVLLGALPDVLVLFWWGEASLATMETLFLLDRVGDGLTFVPFCFASALSAWGVQVIPQQLIREARVQISRPKWRTIRDQVKIVGMVLIVAAGVTIAKVNAGG